MLTRKPERRVMILHCGQLRCPQERGLHSV
jgi:hypothetical protein